MLSAEFISDGISPWMNRFLSSCSGLKSVPADGRDYDITCRATVPQDNWLQHWRIPAISTIEAMSARFRVLAPHDRVPRTAYWDEMIRSKICVSSFGYWRDLLAGFRGDHVRFAPCKTKYEPS